MTSGFVSILIPTYNYSHYVTEAVDSALAQTYPHREIIVIDDGSTDNTRQVLEPYGDQIRYVFQANQGLSAARNTGIRASDGEFIALLDSDDLFHPRKLELQMKCLQQHPEFDLLGTDAFTDRDLCWPAMEEQNSVIPETYVIEQLLSKLRFAPSTVVLRRRCLEKVGLFDPQLRCVEDRDMWIRLANYFVLAKLPLPLLWYRVHPQSLSTKAAKMEEAEWRVLRRAFAESPALKGRFLLRRRTFSYAALIAGHLYDGNRKWKTAFTRVLRSFYYWPLPFPRGELEVSFARTRFLIILILRMLGLVAPDPTSRSIEDED